jgi:hypothetical protein
MQPARTPASCANSLAWFGIHLPAWLREQAARWHDSDVQAQRTRDRCMRACLCCGTQSLQSQAR